MERRLAAIMVADIVAYSSLMEDAEEHTADRAAHCLQVIQEKVTSLGGRVFNTAGDACLAEFGSPINALRCAAEIRNTLAGGPEDDPLRLRFGLHLWSSSSRRSGSGDLSKLPDEVKLFRDAEGDWCIDPAGAFGVDDERLGTVVVLIRLRRIALEAGARTGEILEV